VFLVDDLVRQAGPLDSGLLPASDDEEQHGDDGED